MSGIRISDYTIANLIDNLRSATWQVPKFQREFVWDTSGIASLATSIIDAYPIGMITLWEQSDRDPLDLERLSIQDYDPLKKEQVTRYFGDQEGPLRINAILDGRQRCTAVAMAFAGFMPSFGGSKYCGRYFLNAAQPDPLERVIFKKNTELLRAGLSTTSACIGQGLFPLASEVDGEPLMQQWYRYAQEINNKNNYENGELPDIVELGRRNGILQAAFSGITETRLAACTVPEKYDLGQICEIFETLNLSGMKVSTVDLINAWIYRETEGSEQGAIQIRDWIRDLGQIDGAVGWANTDKRPELIAQIVTAAYVALEDIPGKPEPRRISGNRRANRITSVKSPDLLATPPEHWQSVVRNDAKLALFIGDFQRCVAGGLFGYERCPYPISASIYVALRWHKEFDPIDTHASWDIADLNSLYRGFFWKNALGTRYDQGFLTQLGTDLHYLKSLLRFRRQHASKSEWLSLCDRQLTSDLMKTARIPSIEEFIAILTDGRPGGALQSAIMLPMIAGVDTDIDGVDVSFPGDAKLELHHVFPRRWCANNGCEQRISILDELESGRDWINSVANLIPLSRKTNNDWKDKLPATFLHEKSISHARSRDFCEKSYIDFELFEILRSDSPDVIDFWRRRSRIIAESLLEMTILTVD